MRKKEILLFLLLTFLGCSKSQERSENSKFKHLVEYLENFDYEKAEVEIQELADNNPTSVFSLYGTGLVQENRMLFLDALATYLDVSNTDPTFLPAKIHSYEIFKFLNLEDEAMITAINLIETAPENVDAILTFCDAMLENYDYGRVKKELRKYGFDHDRAGEFHALLATTYLRENKFDSAKAEIEKFSKLNDQSPRSHMLAADYMMTLGQLKSANELSLKAIELSDGDHVFYKRHFFRSIKMKYFDEARKVQKHFVNSGGGEAIESVMGSFLYNAAELYPQAVKSSTVFRKYSGNSISGSYYEFTIRGALGSSLPVTQEMMLIRAILTKGDYLPSFSSIVNYLLTANFATYDSPIEALKEIDNMPKLFTSRKRMRLARLHSLFYSGQPEKAETLNSLMKQAYRSQDRLLSKIGDEYSHKSSRKYDQAEEMYELALEQNQFSENAFKKMLSNFRKKSDHKSALGKFDQHQELVNHFPILKVAKAEFLMRNSNIDEGMKLIKDNFESVSGNLVPIRNIVGYLEESDMLDEVEKVLSITLKYNPNNIEALMLAASYYERNSNFTKLNELSTKAVELESDFYLSQAYLARASYELSDDKTKALEKLTEIALAYKRDPTANLLLSKVMIKEGTDLNKASNFARIAHYSSYMSYETWMNLCYAYISMGRSDLCRGEALKMSRKFKKKPGAFYWIGYAMYNEGKPEAKENLEKSISFGLSGDKLIYAQDLISKL